MNNYKQATRLQLRFATNRGNLSTEQLWGLSISGLVTLIRDLKASLTAAKADDDLAFLSEAVPTQADVENQLRFEIAKDVYLTKKEEQAAATTAQQTKEHNQKILELIQNKKEGELQNKSIEELEAMLK